MSTIIYQGEVMWREGRDVREGRKGKGLEMRRRKEWEVKEWKGQRGEGKDGRKVNWMGKWVREKREGAQEKEGREGTRNEERGGGRDWR